MSDVSSSGRQEAHLAPGRRVCRVDAGHQRAHVHFLETMLPEFRREGGEALQYKDAGVGRLVRGRLMAVLLLGLALGPEEESAEVLHERFGCHFRVGAVECGDERAHFQEAGCVS